MICLCVFIIGTLEDTFNLVCFYHNGKLSLRGENTDQIREVGETLDWTD